MFGNDADAAGGRGRVSNAMEPHQQEILEVFGYWKKISLKPVDSQKRVCYQTDVSESYSVVCATLYLQFPECFIVL